MLPQTEFSFVLPYGFRDAEGTLHQEGTMRLATAFDEIAPLRDPRVQANPGYLILILLSRVITQLGTLPALNPKLLEGLFSADLVYLQDLYQRINQVGHRRFAVACPHCQGEFEVETEPLGESSATLAIDSAKR
ncbi:phage tail assembly protein [Leptolyngbya sp. AN03gr2]|uniref:phage tail assembly protein n=1 Tax=unclassified Leptolyngbya TaxID=2650499 RepID=UPI003D31E7F3